MTKFEQTFESLGNLFTSVAAIIFVMSMIILAMIFHTQTLLYRYLPADMSEFSRTASSIVLAVGFEFTVLLTTTNSQYLKGKWGAGIFAITTFFISAFFFEAFDFSQSLVIISFRFFASFIIAFVNYIYAELFTSKWEEYKGHKKLKEKLEKYLEENKVIGNQLEQTNQTNQLLQNQLKEANQRLEGLEKREKARLKYLTCNYCKDVFETEAALRGHKGRCMMNPKNQDKRYSLSNNGK